MAKRKFSLWALFLLALGAWVGGNQVLAFTCTDPPAGDIIVFQGAILGFPEGDIMECGTASSPTPATCQLKNRVYATGESLCVNSELGTLLDYIPNAFFPATQNNYETDRFTLSGWPGDLGKSGSTWIIAWDHIESETSPDYAGYYAAQSDIVLFGERGRRQSRPCNCNLVSCTTSCVNPVLVTDTDPCTPVVGTPIGDIPRIGTLAPVPVPLATSVIMNPALGFTDPAAEITLAWQDACNRTVTTYDNAPDPIMGYRLEVFVDRLFNGVADLPADADLPSDFYRPFLDIAPLADTSDAIPDIAGDITTTGVVVPIAPRTGPGDVFEDPATIESVTFRLRVLFLDDRFAPAGVGGKNGTIHPVPSLPSARGTSILAEEVLCVDLDGDGFGFPGSIFCPGGALADCDDTDPAVFPGAIEVPDGIDNDCDGLVDEVSIASTCEIQPSSLNLSSQGNTLSIKTTLTDSASGDSLDPALLAPVHISRISSPGVGDIVLPVPRAEPGCDDMTEDGIWETLADRSVTGAGVGTLRFNSPSDGQCETMDGNRQDIIAVMLDIPDGETAQICYTSTYPGGVDPIECCGATVVTNHGNR